MGLFPLLTMVTALDVEIKLVAKSVDTNIFDNMFENPLFSY